MGKKAIEQVELIHSIIRSYMYFEATLARLFFWRRETGCSVFSSPSFWKVVFKLPSVALTLYCYDNTLLFPPYFIVDIGTVVWSYCSF